MGSGEQIAAIELEHRLAAAEAKLVQAEQKIAELLKAIRESKECFDAAYAEGFPEAFRDRNHDKVYDIIDRRILYALAPLINKLEAEREGRSR